MSGSSRGADDGIPTKTRRLVIIFVLSVVAAGAVEIAAVVALHPAEPLGAHAVVEGIVLASLAGVAAVLVGVLSIFGRLVPETVPLNAIPSQRRQAVSKAVRSNDPASLRDTEMCAALDYAATYERNTPLILLRAGLTLAFFVLAALLLVLVGIEASQVAYYFYFLVMFVLVAGTFVLRRRTLRRVRQFIAASPTFIEAT